MSIWNEALTKGEYLRRLFAAKADQRKEDAQLSFEQKVEIVLALQGVSRELRDSWAPKPRSAGSVRTLAERGDERELFRGGR